MKNLSKILKICAIIPGIVLVSYAGKISYNLCKKEEKRDPDYIKIVIPTWEGRIEYEMKKEASEEIETIDEISLYSDTRTKVVNKKFKSYCYAIPFVLEKYFNFNPSTYINEEQGKPKEREEAFNNFINKKEKLGLKK